MRESTHPSPTGECSSTSLGGHVLCLFSVANNSVGEAGRQRVETPKNRLEVVVSFH
jgi:hypothetical protein